MVSIGLNDFEHTVVFKKNVMYKKCMYCEKIVVSHLEFVACYKDTFHDLNKYFILSLF